MSAPATGPYASGNSGKKKIRAASGKKDGANSRAASGKKEGPGSRATSAKKAEANKEARADSTSPARQGAAPRKKREYTAEEQKEKLNNYIEVRPNRWGLIRYNTHVRYYGVDGKFRAGGFVLKNPFVTTPAGSTQEKTFLLLRNGFLPKVKGYATWLVAYEDIQALYMKPPAESLEILGKLQDAIIGLNRNDKELAKHARELEIRIAALEHQLAQIEKR
jgi:hypothetical protein